MASRYGRVELTDRSCTFNFRTETGARGASKAFADTLVDRLTTLLAEQRQKHASLRVARARDEMREFVFELEATRRRNRDQQAELLDAAGRADLSAETLLANIGKLEDERQRLELDLAGMEARLEAVHEQFARAGRRRRSRRPTTR